MNTCFAAKVIIKIVTGHHLNKPYIATFGYSYHPTTRKYLSLKNMRKRQRKSRVAFIQKLAKPALISG